MRQIDVGLETDVTLSSYNHGARGKQQTTRGSKRATILQAELQAQHISSLLLDLRQ